MINQFVKATTHLSSKLTVNIAFLLSLLSPDVERLWDDNRNVAA